MKTEMNEDTRVDDVLAALQALLETLPVGSTLIIQFPAGFWTPGGASGTYTAWVNEDADGNRQYAGELS